jgi:hypothetical protein
MPGRFEWLERIKSVEREYSITGLAMTRFVDAVHASPSLLTGGRPRDLGRASDHLEGTYLIRLFAEFERGLRGYWRVIRPASRGTLTRNLLDSIGAARRVPQDAIDNAHEVREHRNGLVHEMRALDSRMTLARARGHLCTYFSHLPLNW